MTLVIPLSGILLFILILTSYLGVAIYIFNKSTVELRYNRDEMVKFKNEMLLFKGEIEKEMAQLKRDVEDRTITFTQLQTLLKQLEQCDIKNIYAQLDYLHKDLKDIKDIINRVYHK